MAFKTLPHVRQFCYGASIIVVPFPIRLALAPTLLLALALLSRLPTRRPHPSPEPHPPPVFIPAHGVAT